MNVFFTSDQNFTFKVILRLTAIVVSLFLLNTALGEDISFSQKYQQKLQENRGSYYVVPTYQWSCSATVSGDFSGITEDAVLKATVGDQHFNNKGSGNE